MTLNCSFQLTLNVMSSTTDSISLFDRINLARCAMERATSNAFDKQRFDGEYDTARSWTKYKCNITTLYSFVDHV